MPEQELNLFQLSSAVMTQLRTGPPQVVRCDVLQARSPTAGPDHVPHHILRNALTPYLARPGDCPKDLSFGDPCGCRPLTECGFDPCRNGHSADVATLADQVYDCPVSLAHLDFIHLQTHQLRSAKATAKQHGQHRVVALGAHAIARSVLQYF